MKKLLYLLLAPLLLAGCEGVYERQGSGAEDGTGTIVLRSFIDTGIDDITRTSVDPYTYTLILDGPGEPIVMTVPENNTIKNITPGSYTITLTSHPDGIPAPVFDTPVYQAVLDGVEIEADTTTPIELKCTQANAGIRFEYDPSIIQAGILNLVPRVTQGGDWLEFLGKTKNSTGYFPAGDAVVTMEDAGNPMPIEGMESKTLPLKAGQLWRIKLKYTQTRAGGALEWEVLQNE